MEGGHGVAQGPAQLQNEDKIKKNSPYGPSYGTLQDSTPHDDLDDEPPRPPLTLWTLGLGLLLTLVFIIAAVLMGTCLVHMGKAVPTLELIAISYGIQLVFFIPFVACNWQDFRETTQVHIVWLLASGMCVSLGFLCFYQAALTLPGNVISAMGFAGFLLLTFLFTLSLDCTFDRIYSAICLVSFVGLVMMTVSMARSAYSTGWMTIVSARSLVSREGIEADQGGSVQTETATLDPSIVEPSNGDEGDQDYQPSPDPDPRSQLMYAYITIIMGAFLTSVGCLIIHRRLHSTPLSSFLFWIAAVGTVLATLEMALFTDPSWPTREHALPVAGFLFLFSFAAVAVISAWRHIPPTLFAMVATFSLIVYMILAAAAPSFVSLLPVSAPQAIEIVGAVVVLVALIAAVVWVIKGIHSDVIKQ